MAFKTYLKGTVQTTISANGNITKQATWLLIADPAPSGYNAWIAFEAEVAAWAGNVGDFYKKPVQDATSAECTTYVEDTAFKVSSVNWRAVEGRTHYEVAFEYVQNDAVLRPLGNVNVDVNNNNERTKSITYALDVTSLEPAPDPAAIDPHLFDSGEVIDWGDGLYMIESSNYSAQTPSSYLITVNAKDMSKMMVGNVTKAQDAFGQRTMSVTWKLSLEAYYDEVIPQAGESIGTWFGTDEVEAEWVIASVTETPDGVLGYTIALEAKHIAKRVMRIEQKSVWSMEDSKASKSATITYRTPPAEDNFASELDRVGTSAAGEGFEGQTITDIAVNQTGKEDYEIVLSTGSDDAGNRLIVTSFAPATLEREVAINMNYAKYYLTAKDCGWFPTGGGVGYAEWNRPPTITFERTVTPKQLKDSSSTYWTEAKIVACAKDMLLDTEPIIRILMRDGTEITAKNQFAGASDLIAAFKVSTYVYAQPFNATNPTVAGLYFRAWDPVKHAPIWPESVNPPNLTGWPKYPGTDLYWAINFRWINRGIPYMDISVTKNYRGEPKDVIKNHDWNDYYVDAIDEISNVKFKSYKFKGLNVSGLRDNLGNQWTAVTVNLWASLLGKFNPNFEEDPGGF